MDVVVAVIGPAHALKGEVSVDLRTDVPEERIYPGAEFRTEPADKGPLTVAAELLRGVKLIVDSDDFDDEDDAWYAHELEGMRVQTVDGEDRGVVRDLMYGVGQDLLVIDWNGKEVLVPFVEEIVPEVDEEAGLIVVDPPVGLFNEEEE